MKYRLAVVVLALISVVLGSCSQPAAPTTGAKKEQPWDDTDLIRVALVTGGHAFEVPEFYKLFRELPGVDAYPQHMEHFASSSEAARDAYDAVVFYGMNIMKEVAWAREVGQCRVFVLTLGDNPKAWSNPGFRDVLSRGIAWAAGEN